MAFYAPEVFNSTEEEDYEKAHRILQPFYEWLITGREDFFRSALFVPLFPLAIYKMTTLLYTCTDLLTSRVDRLKSSMIQKNRVISWNIYTTAFLNTLWNEILFILPITYAQWIWVPPTPLPPVAPKLWDLIWQLIAFSFFFDFNYWVLHVTMHKVRWFYKYVHSIHHQYHSTFALMSNSLHPFELLFIGFNSALVPWPFKPHILTYWAWLFVSVVVSIEVHAGYDFSWGLHNFFPFYGGAPCHDMHHMRPMSNFEPWFNHLDRLFGWKLTLDDLAKMSEERRKQLPVQDETGLKRIN